MTDVRTTLESQPTATATATAPHTTHEPDGFRRVAAIAGIAAVVAGMVTIPLMGSAPALGDSAEDIGAYFAGNADLHRPAVVIAALLAIPIVLFFAGVHRALVVSSGRSASAWATVFLYGAIMMSATAGLKEALYAVAVRYAATDPDLGVLALVSHASSIAGATLGAWLAVTVAAVGIAAWRDRTAPRWYAGLCCLVAGLAVVSVIETVSTSTGGALSGAAFGSFILWMLTSAVAMLRRPLLA
jgi:hypothetical protein